MGATHWLDPLGRKPILILTTGIVAFHLATIREGHRWGGDFSQYVHHAKNIVERTDYAAIGYIYNPRYPSVAPRTYPPVFPLILAPIYALTGLDLQPMKVVVVLFLGAALVVLYELVHRRMSAPGPVLLAFLVGMNPYVWEFKDNVVSDLPFLFFAVLSLWVAESVLQLRESRAPGALRLGLLLGFLMYLAYGTRSVGVAIPVALVLASSFHTRSLRLGPATVVSLACFISLALVQNAVLDSDASYLHQLSEFSPATPLRNAITYAKALRGLWENGISLKSSQALTVVISIVAFASFVRSLRRAPTILELFALTYAAILLLWPSNERLRFLLPIVPLYFFHALQGSTAIGARLVPPRARTPTVVLSASLVAATYVGGYVTRDFGPIQSGPQKTESASRLLKKSVSRVEGSP